MIALDRPDGAVATLTRPGVPESTIALPRRGLPDLLSEELRRLDPDEVYGDVLRSLGEHSGDTA
jgi:glucose-6-phosphate dehydrogenase assembly protein OpcA